MRAAVVFETRSPMSGLIRVVDRGRERRLVVEGSVLSVLPRDGDWRAVRREYWWQALAAMELPRRPSVLFVGLGGGTQIHLLRQLARPRWITVIERDPWIIRVAHKWFGLAPVGRLEILCAEADLAAASLARTRRRFDFVMEDAAYGDAPESALRLGRMAASLVGPGGVLVVNRHQRGDARALVAALAPCFDTISVRCVRREAENLLVCCRRAPRRRPAR